jgi:hypothetical protein
MDANTPPIFWLTHDLEQYLFCSPLYLDDLDRFILCKTCHRYRKRIPHKKTDWVRYYEIAFVRHYRELVEWWWGHGFTSLCCERNPDVFENLLQREFARELLAKRIVLDVTRTMAVEQCSYDRVLKKWRSSVVRSDTHLLERMEMSYGVPLTMTDPEALAHLADQMKKGMEAEIQYQVLRVLCMYYNNVYHWCLPERNIEAVLVHDEFCKRIRVRFPATHLTVFGDGIPVSKR